LRMRFLPNRLLQYTYNLRPLLCNKYIEPEKTLNSKPQTLISK